MSRDKAVPPGAPAHGRDPVWRRKLKRATTIAISVLASVALFIVIVFTCIEAVAFDEGRYARLYQQFGIVQDTGMTADELTRVTHELLLYCRGERDNLDIQAVINGQTREVFSQREKDHMVDVQKLFVRGTKIRTVAVICLLFLLLLLIYVSRRRAARELARGWLISVCVLGALLVAVGVVFAVDFDWAWTQFHYIFFTNDLWLLYADDMLILMLIKLFSSLVRSIIIASAVSLAAVTAGAVLVARLDRKKKTTDAKAESHEPEQRT